VNSKTLQQFAGEPAAFQRELIIPSAQGTQRFSDCMAPFQLERFAGINPTLLAVAQGIKPETGRHWWEATKGASKDSDLAVCLLWLLAFTARPLQVQIGAADKDQAAEMQKAAKDILRLNPWLSKRVKIQNWRIICDATDSTCEIIAADIAGSHGASSPLKKCFDSENERFGPRSRRKIAGESVDSSRFFNEDIRSKDPFGADLTFSTGC